MSSSRPLFDPARRTSSPSGSPAVMTVSQLTAMIQRALAVHLPPTLHVVGQISNLSRPASGHLYLTLKDEGSELRCVMWKSVASSLKFKPIDGLEVVATGSIEVYGPRGQYQLYVRRLEPRGVGALELAFRQLREKLGHEGLFEPEHKKPLPTHPRRIAIVTSETGAAIRDMLKVLRRRFPCIDVMLHPVRVQGEGSADEIAAAIGRIDKQSRRLGGIDVMIVGRGGGSLEDLWAFNEEVVARAIHRCSIPIVSAVGHEIDVTIADLVGDVRAATPTAAAVLVVPELSELLSDLDRRAAQLRRHARHTLELARSRLTGLERQELFRDPLAYLRRGAQRVDDASGRLKLAIGTRLDELLRRLGRYESVLAAIQPWAVLQKQQRRLTDAHLRLRWALDRRSRAEERRLAAKANALHSVSPQHRIVAGAQTIDHLHTRLAAAIAHRFELDGERLGGLAARLESTGHPQVLRRGFTITRKVTGRKLVTDPANVRPGERIETETAAGTLHSTVVDKDQPGLFE